MTQRWDRDLAALGAAILTEMSKQSPALHAWPDTSEILLRQIEGYARCQARVNFRGGRVSSSLLFPHDMETTNLAVTPIDTVSALAHQRRHPLFE